MEWFILGLAVVVEIGWALSLKWTTAGGASKLVVFVPIALSFVNMYLLAQAMRTIPPGTAYAIWTGLGAAGVAVGSCFIFKQNISIPQMAFILLIVVGVAGTKVFSQA